MSSNYNRVEEEKVAGESKPIEQIQKMDDKRNTEKITRKWYIEEKKYSIQ